MPALFNFAGALCSSSTIPCDTREGREPAAPPIKTYCKLLWWSDWNIQSYRAAQTGADSSRYSDSSSPSSCLVYIGSRAEGWTGAPSWRSHTGSAPPAPASRCHPPPHTAWGCAVAGCRCRRWSRCPRHAGSPSRPQREPHAGLLQDKTDRGQVTLWSLMS